MIAAGSEDGQILPTASFYGAQAAVQHCMCDQGRFKLTGESISQVAHSQLANAQPAACPVPMLALTVRIVCSSHDRLLVGRGLSCLQCHRHTSASSHSNNTSGIVGTQMEKDNMHCGCSRVQKAGRVPGHCICTWHKRRRRWLPMGCRACTMCARRLG